MIRAKLEYALMRSKTYPVHYFDSGEWVSELDTDYVAGKVVIKGLSAQVNSIPADTFIDVVNPKVNDALCGIITLEVWLRGVEKIDKNSFKGFDRGLKSLGLSRTGIFSDWENISDNAEVLEYIVGELWMLESLDLPSLGDKLLDNEFAEKLNNICKQKKLKPLMIAFLNNR